MKVEDCIFHVQRRTTGGCIDLAFAFTREFAVPLFGLTTVFAVPSCLITYWLASNQSETLMLSGLVFAVFTAFFSGALVAGVGPQMFGVELRWTNSIRGMLKRFFGYGFVVGLVRIIQWISMLCFFWPALIVSPLIGHVAEICYLEQGKIYDIPSRVWALSGGAGYARNFLRMVTLLMLWVLLAVGVFLRLILLPVLCLTRQFFPVASDCLLTMRRISGGC